MVLEDIKKMIGFEEGYNVFDIDLRLEINNAISVLEQVGAHVKKRLSYDTVDDWDDIFDDDSNLDMIKQYIFLRTKLIFDPPATGAIMEAYKEQIKELEWRINIGTEINPITMSFEEYSEKEQT